MDDHDHIKATDKIADGALRKLFAEDRGRTATVIVEIALPERQVDLTRGEHDVGAWRPWRVVPEPEEERRRKEEIVRRARSFLEEVVDEDPVWLAASDAFVVDVGSEELHALIRSPLVRRISLNQLRR